MRARVVALLLLACFACAAAVRDGPRLRETALAPAITAASVESANRDAPERVAGYFRLDRTHAAEMFYFYFQALSLLMLMLMSSSHVSIHVIPCRHC